MLKIQLSNPIALPVKLEESVSLDEVLELIFPLENEHAYLNWNHCHIPLSYKYDISVLTQDLIKIYDFTQNEDTELEIHWASNTFASVWHLQKINGHIHIQTKWENVSGGLTELLNTKTSNVIPVQDLESELSKILKFLKQTIINNVSNINYIEDNGLEKV